MNPLDLKDILYIGGIVLSAVITFLATKHKLKELIPDKFDETKNEITALKLEKKDEIAALKLDTEKLRGKSELQEQIINKFQNQVLSHLPALFKMAGKKRDGRAKR